MNDITTFLWINYHPRYEMGFDIPFSHFRENISLLQTLVFHESRKKSNFSFLSLFQVLHKNHLWKEDHYFCFTVWYRFYFHFYFFFHFYFYLQTIEQTSMCDDWIDFRANQSYARISFTSYNGRWSKDQNSLDQKFGHVIKSHFY